ncbi:glucosamine-6-phosphate deaminase [Sporosarcina sp. FSL K6-3457]|uniref:glucosamine-6-phosphate deaminase n=1 Tax=Sporosarcina sp. FSL K6-3457 TaxID=2978204 RepID=UPI0030F52EC5
MKVLVFENYDAASEQAAQLVEAQVIENGQSVLGLATGSTPVGLYKELIEGVKKRGVSYKNVSTINLDEYIGLPADHAESYHTFMAENLFNHIDISIDNTHVPNGMASSPEDECVRYEEIIDRVGPIDLQILGIGTNGHIGFNEPGTDPESLTHIAELVASTRESNARFFPSIDDVPTHAVTTGIKSILKSKKIVLIASGASKAEAVKQLLSKEISQDFPASYLWNHADVTLIVDKEAYALVQTEGQ